MSLNKFKISHEDELKYHVLTPGGKTLTVSKEGLSKHAHAVIKEMKHMSSENVKEELGAEHFDDGGQASPEESFTESPADLAAKWRQFRESQPQNEAPAAPPTGPRSDAPELPEILNQQLPIQNQSTGNPAEPENPNVFQRVATRLQDPSQRPDITNVDEAMKNVGMPVAGTIGRVAGPMAGEFANIATNLESKAVAKPLADTVKSLLQKLSLRFGSDSDVVKTVAEHYKDILPRMAEGGQVKKYYEGTKDAPAGMEDDPLAADEPNLGKFAATPAEIQTAAAANQTAPVATQAPAMAQTAPPSTGAPDLSSGLQEQKKAQSASAAATTGQGKAEMAAIDAQTSNLADLPTQQDIIDDNQAKSDSLFKAYQDAKIDPNRIYKNQSTGSKILSGIGMLLGGIGAGIGGGPNMAIQAMDKAINNDIDAQKNDQSNKMNLWKMNREALGSDLQANMATRNQALIDTKYQLMRAASQFKGPQALAAAQNTNAMIDQELAKNHFIQSVLSPTQESTQGAAPGTEQAFVNHNQHLQTASGMSPLIAQQYKENTAKYIPSVGVSSIVPTPADRSELMNYTDLNKNIEDALAFQQTGPGADIGAWSFKNRSTAAGIQNNIITSMGPLLYNIKRFSPDLAAKFEARVGNPGSLDAFGSNAAALKQLQKDVQQRQSTLQNQLGVKEFQKAPADITAVTWAKANPSDPRAQRILKANGQ